MKDNFSKQSDLYAQYRPTYPQELFTYIFKFVKERNAAWDCGTGNGQVAKVLAGYFNKVYATDISSNQLKNAAKADNIIYKVEPAERTSFADNSFDLITVAQAIHWFDFKQFYKEVKRTSKPGGTFAAIGYGLMQTSGETNNIILHFYLNIIGAYWDQERKYIDENYQTIPFPFNELKSIAVNNTVDWNIVELMGYLNTWSAVQHYKEANQNKNPIDLVFDELKQSWGDIERKTFSFPILLRLGRIEK